MNNHILYEMVEMHPFTIILLIVVGVLILLSKKQYIPLYFFTVMCSIPITQSYLIFGLNFNIMRFMILLFLIRWILKNDVRLNQILKVDILIIIYALLRVIIYTVNVKSISGFIYSMGLSYNIIGYYFIFRTTINGKDDFYRLLKWICVISLCLLPFWLKEKVTGINTFSSIGGVRELSYIRGGSLRVQGAFSHPILAGTFWALMLPLIHLIKKENKILGNLGCIASIILLFLTDSSTAYVIALLYVLGYLVYPIRTHRKILLFLFPIGYFILSLIMDSPPYYLISLIDLAGGSTGWHRYIIIDRAIENMNNWFWFGMGEISTEIWGTGLWDITNEYVAIAVSGGIISVLIFISIIAVSIEMLNKSLKRNVEDKIYWNLLVLMIMHLIAFLVISYFSQLQVMFFFSVSCIASLSIYDKKVNNEIRKI